MLYTIEYCLHNDRYNEPVILIKNCNLFEIRQTLAESISTKQFMDGYGLNERKIIVLYFDIYNEEKTFYYFFMIDPTY